MNNYSNHIDGEDIYGKIKADILSLKLNPGQMISENEIAKKYNVSRTPVKTAFSRLKGERYIEIIPQKGSFVTLLDMKYIKDIIYMRTILEMNMLTQIVNSGDNYKVISALESNLHKQSELLDAGDVSPTAFFDIDSLFHYSLFEAVGHEKMWDIIQDLQVYYTRFRILDTLTTARYHELYRDHVNILQALKDGDIKQLEKNVYNHLHGNIQRLAPKIEGEFREYFT